MSLAEFDAFLAREGVAIPQHSPKGDYSGDWWSGHAIVWWWQYKHFVNMPINALEVGSFEGRSAEWMLDTLLASSLGVQTLVSVALPDC